MVVENYINHTAATYRGIHGQICSIFPKYGGSGGWHDNFENLPDTRYYGLTDVLKEYSYETIFLNPILRDSTHIDEMLSRIGFDKVLNAENLSNKFLEGVKPLQGDRLSDQQLFSSLIDFLKDKNKSNKQEDNPFFLALYPSETHAWKDVTEDGKKFNSSEFNNRSLNTIHNLDDAFGKFWKYYKSSPYSKNTIIVFTSDHAHYQEKAYIELMKIFKEDDYQRIFVDRTPLIIHDPTRNLPKSFNADNATSIDFTPSIIHYLGLESKKNPFIGKSIFISDRKFYNYGVASIGNAFYIIDDDKIHSLGNSTKYRNLLKTVTRYIKKTQELELTNRIIPSD